MITTRDDATAAILGAILLSDAALDVALGEGVRPEHFHRPEQAAIYRAMLALHDAGEPVDHLTVKARLGVGSPSSPITAADVDRLIGPVPLLGNLHGYCRIVREEARLANAGRVLTRAGEAFANRDLEAVLREVAALDAPEHTQPRLPAADEFVAWYESERAGIPFPWSTLTEATGGGMQPGDVTVIGGWPGHGKSFLADMLVEHATLRGARCEIFASEMSRAKRIVRFLVRATGIPEKVIREKRLDVRQWGQVKDALVKLPCEIEVSASWPVEEYCRALRRGKYDLAVIDTVTRLPCSRVDEWDRASGMLADAARQTDTHLILVCQLNLGRDDGAVRPIPTGRDLRNTGAWYQDARVVMFVHRDQELVEGTKAPRILSDGHIRIDKATHGDLSAGGFLAVTFNPRWLRFDPLDEFSARHLEAA